MKKLILLFSLFFALSAFANPEEVKQVRAEISKLQAEDKALLEQLVKLSAKQDQKKETARIRAKYFARDMSELNEVIQEMENSVKEIQAEIEKKKVSPRQNFELKMTKWNSEMNLLTGNLRRCAPTINVEDFKNKEHDIDEQFKKMKISPQLGEKAKALQTEWVKLQDIQPLMQKREESHAKQIKTLQMELKEAQEQLAEELAKREKLLKQMKSMESDDDSLNKERAEIETRRGKIAERLSELDSILAAYETND